MQTIATVLAVISTASSLFAQGLVNFANSQSTLISAGGVAMPAGSTNQFIFAVFLAPSDTVSGPGQTVAFDDPRFQLAAAYNTHWPITSGRMFNRNNVDVTSAGGNPNGFGPGSTVDFVVRGWSANAGATWAEALAAYLNWGSIPMYIGTSTVGDNLVLGGDSIPVPSLFGSATWQVGGFNMALVNICIGPCLMGPVLVYPTASQTVNRGSSVTLYASVYACPPRPRHQWWVNGVAIPKATNASYQLGSAQPTDAGSYRVVVDNGCGYTLEGYAWLTVLESPASQTAEAGAHVRLALHASGNQPLRFRWTFNGSPILSGATNSVLELNNVQPSQSGSYAVMVTNAGTVVTTTPAMLNVIAPVERRLVPRLTLSGQLATPFNLEYSETLAATQYWASLVALDLTNSPDFFFDLASPLPPQRFYRAWQTTMATNPPSLGLNLIPALTLTGNPGDQVRVEGINQFGPTDAWFTLDTVTLTNTSQLYFEVTAPGQPARLYRLVPVP